MSTRSPDSNEKGSIFASREVAEQWHRGKVYRAEISGAANEMMLDLADLRAGDRVLDVAAGTGDQTLMAAQRVGPTGYVLAIDLSASMLKIADEALRNAGLTNVETRVLDAEKIDLDPDSFDAVICRMGLMLFSNPVKALIGMRRVVKPTGKVVAVVLSIEEKNQYLAIPLAIVRRLGRIPSPTQGDRGTFALGGPGVLEDAYRRAGFLDVAVHAVTIRRRFQSVAEAVRAMKDFFSPFFLQELMAKLGDAERELAWAEIEWQLGQFKSPDGLEVPGEALIAVGTK
jgi:ubiquinone/menaquinone biosynthesis C-methylase UbiE